jgi:hypothetical protein
VYIGKCRNFSPTLLAEVDDIHVCIWGSRETLVSLCYLKWRMTLLKYGSPLYFTKSSVERKKGTPHVLHRRANLRPRRKAQACGTSMNGLPKFDSWPCGSATSFWSFSFWLPLSLQIGNLVGLYHDCDNMRSCKISLYKQPIHHHLKHVYLSYGFASFSLLCHRCSLSIPSACACMHGQPGVQISRIVRRFEILHWEKENKVFLKHLHTSRDHHDGSSFIQVNGAMYHRLCHQRGTSVRQRPCRQLYSFLIFKMRNCFVNCVRRLGLKNFSVLNVTLTNDLPILPETIISVHAKNLTTSLQLNPVCATFTLLVTTILK